jgi:hypothetical protein
LTGDNDNESRPCQALSCSGYDGSMDVPLNGDNITMQLINEAKNLSSKKDLIFSINCRKNLFMIKIGNDMRINVK